MKNPSVSVQPPAGRPLPANWAKLAPQAAAQADRDYLDRLQNAWRGSPQQNPPAMRAARLTTDAADPAGSSQPRFDGRLVLERADADGFEIWRDDTTGAIVRRRLTWDDIIGKK